MREYPGNSHASKIVRLPIEKEEEKPEQEPRKKVVEGKVTVRPQPIGKRIKNMFASDNGSFIDHLVENIVVPMFREMIITMVVQAGDGLRQAVEQKMFGEIRSNPSNYRHGGRGPISYNRYSSSGLSTFASRHRDDAPPYNPAGRRSNVVKEIVLESREDVEEVLAELDGVIERQGHCTVGDLYSAVDVPVRSTDELWGWTDLSQARATAVRNGYLINVPRPQALR